MYEIGQTVRIIRDNYPGEPGERSFVGQTGTVTGTQGKTITIRGINPDLPQQAYGFYPEEIEPA